MGTIDTLGLALGTAWTAGINLYATIAVLGIAQAAGWMQLPPGLEVLGDPLVITIAVALYVVEFCADKVPVVDSGWDAVHTFIRVPAGAILAAQALGPMNPALEVAAALAGGSVALAAHGTKATARLAINTSPEPFSNWFASLAEDAAAIGGIWLALNHPILMLTAVAIFVVVAAIMIPKIIRGLAALFRRLRGGGTPPSVAAVGPPPQVGGQT